MGASRDLPRARRTRAGGAKKRPTRYAPAGDTPPPLAAALRAHRKSELEVARRLYQEWLAVHVGCVDAWMNLGAADVKLGRAREAAAAFAQALALRPDDARVQRDAGIGLMAVGQHRAARAALETAVYLNGSLTGAWLALARLCAELGDKAAAEGAARNAVAVAPRDGSAWLELHRVLFDAEALAPCIAAAEMAVAVDPDYPLARFLLAASLAAAGRSHALSEDDHIAPGWRDALAYTLAQRRAGAAVFATKRETLLHAAAHARGDGPVLEFGVRHGVSTRVLAGAVDAPVHAFDSFEGLPEVWQGQAAGAFSTQGELPDFSDSPGRVVFHVGRFEATLPRAIHQLQSAPRLVHIDSDLYSSAQAVLARLGPHLTCGCVLVFDEYVGNATWRQDEHRAFAEACAAHRWTPKTLSMSWFTGQAAFVIR